jgi:hypothetical protein
MEKEETKILNLTNEEKRVLLDALGYDVDEESYIIDSQGNKVIDKYSDIPVKLERASILPGSTVIVDTNTFSLSEYFEDPELSRD